MKKPSFFALLIVAMLIVCCTSVSAQTVNIPYQGYIADKSGKPYSGTFQFKFSIVGPGGNPVQWNSGAVSLPVASGIYSVILGATGQSALPAALFVNNANLYLRISFNDGVHGEQTLVPDVKLLPVPYAVRAMYADTSFVQTALPPMDSLVLRDSQGVVRFVMNPNTGTFSMKNNDTTWYSIAVNSPPTEKVNHGDFTTETTRTENGATVEARDNKTGKVVESRSYQYNSEDNSTTEERKVYDKSGNVSTEEKTTKKADGTSTNNFTNYGEDGKTKEYESTSETKDGTTTERWKENNENGETESSGERTSVNGELTGSKKFDKSGNLKEETTRKDGKTTTTYYKDGKPTSKVETEETADGSSHTSTKYDENGQPISERKQTNKNGQWKWENKNLKDNKSSNNEPAKTVEESANSTTTTEPGKIEFKLNNSTFGIGINPITNQGELWYTTAGSSEIPRVYFNASEEKSGIYIPEVWMIDPVFGRRSNVAWDSQNNFRITVSDTSTGFSTGMFWDPIGRSVTSTNDIIVGGSLKGDTIKPKSKPTVIFSSGVTVNGQSFFGNTIDVSGAAQIQQNGTFTGTAAVVQNATVQQQLRTNQIFPVSPATTVTINGNLNVVGNLTKGGGNFKIDHPLDPYNKYLIHSFVESPERTNIYSGNIVTDANGIGIVTLPAYFEAVNADFRYQLTAIGANARAWITAEISNNIFTVQTDMPNVKVSWQITSTRTDNFAKDNPYSPEQEKEPEMKGKLLYPTK